MNVITNNGGCSPRRRDRLLWCLKATRAVRITRVMFRQSSCTRGVVNTARPSASEVTVMPLYRPALRGLGLHKLLTQAVSSLTLNSPACICGRLKRLDGPFCNRGVFGSCLACGNAGGHSHIVLRSFPSPQRGEPFSALEHGNPLSTLRMLKNQDDPMSPEPSTTSGCDLPDSE